MVGLLLGKVSKEKGMSKPLLVPAWPYTPKPSVCLNNPPPKHNAIHVQKIRCLLGLCHLTGVYEAVEINAKACFPQFIRVSPVCT